MAHVPLVEKPQGALQHYAWRYSRKVFGKVVEPVRAAAHHNGVLMASGALETVVGRRWHELDENLRRLAELATSAAIGCSWCIDYGYYESVSSGLDPQKVRDVAHWRESPVYDDRERLVLEYAEAVNRTPSAMTDDLAARLREHFSAKQIVELAAWVALENNRSRFNAGLGLRSESFSDSCAVPLSAVGA
jgi:AhpD family alkylhydroperoxidase